MFPNRSLSIYQTIRVHIPADGDLRNHRRYNLKYYQTQLTCLHLVCVRIRFIWRYDRDRNSFLWRNKKLSSKPCHHSLVLRIKSVPIRIRTAGKNPLFNPPKVQCSVQDPFTHRISVPALVAHVSVVMRQHNTQAGTPYVTVAARSKVWTVFAGPNAGVMGSNPTQGTAVYVSLFCLCCSVCRKWPCDALISHPRSPTDCVYRIKKLKKRPGSNKRT
jgi:hypothetical protein